MLSFHLLAGLGQSLTYTLGWAAFAVCLLSAGIALRSHAARLTAIVLLTVTVLKGFLSDLRSLDGLYRVMSFVGLAVCLSLVAVVLQRFVLRAPQFGETRMSRLFLVRDALAAGAMSALAPSRTRRRRRRRPCRAAPASTVRRSGTSDGSAW